MLQNNMHATPLIMCTLVKHHITSS